MDITPLSRGAGSTFRWCAASSIWRSCSTGSAAAFCRDGCRSPWRRRSASRRWRTPWRVTASRRSSTPTKARSSPERPSPASSPTRASRSAWTAKAPGGTMSSSGQARRPRACGAGVKYEASCRSPTREQMRVSCSTTCRQVARGLQIVMPRTTRSSWPGSIVMAAHGRTPMAVASLRDVRQPRIRGWVPTRSAARGSTTQDPQ